MWVDSLKAVGGVGVYSVGSRGGALQGRRSWGVGWFLREQQAYEAFLQAVGLDLSCSGVKSGSPPGGQGIGEGESAGGKMQIKMP